MNRTTVIILMLLFWVAVGMLISANAEAIPAPYPTPSDSQRGECAALYFIHSSLIVGHIDKQVDPDPSVLEMANEIAENGLDVVRSLRIKHNLSEDAVVARFLREHISRMDTELDEMGLASWFEKYEQKCIAISKFR